ncbi:CBS-domain-containing membrane protein [Anaerolinea thermolimosa]|uniref:CBS domain-containing protein n=1 Tax=Anaerolinea thermolimosa TaxID=229919 RepID=UPI000780F911|nr:CBS domain-containing protein [Anaerolinea thermolimosa]GAP06021.1 CBS-domain-containing membrane protein [Anaerolinea thermolimosa]
MMIVRDFMQKNFTCVSPQCTVKSAAEEMIHKGVDTLFVTENDEVVGVIGIRDLFTLPIPASFGGPMKIMEEGNLIRGWEDTPVEQLMNPNVISVPENYPIMGAAMRMINEGKHPLAILHGKKLIGIIDRSDIVKALLKMDVST